MGLCTLFGGVLQARGLARPGVDDGATVAMGAAALVTLLAGAGLFAWSRPTDGAHFGRRHAVIAVTGIWFGAGLFGGLPFVFDAGLSPVDALFEAISGFSTTGATVVADIEGTLSRPLLLWRSLMQWLGGMGIVVLFVAVAPNIGVGGKHLFRSEVPGPTADGLQPRIAETAIVLWRIYVGLTVAAFGLLWALGMSAFEAICHALTTMATGGFSTRNDSIAAFDSAAIELVIVVFMLLAGTNFGLFFAAWRQRSGRPLWRSTEIRVYLGMVALATVLITLWTAGMPDRGLPEAFRAALFQVASFITSTGYGTDAYMAWPHAAVVVLLLLMVSGACAGSTSGGMKVSRIVILAEAAWAAIGRTIRPSVVRVVRLDRKAVTAEVLAEVGAFLTVFLAAIAVVTLLVAWFDGAPPDTAFAATLTCISNMGPAPFHLEADNFASFSDGTKALFAFAMVLGRLEFFTLLALFVPEFWRR